MTQTCPVFLFSFFFNDTATTEIYTLSLHDALPISLKGGRLDDVSLAQYHETVDPTSPAIILLSPSGSPHPFYAEFGWVGAAGATVKTPGPDTVWRQQCSGSLGPGQPITLIYDNGEGLVFRRTVAIDDKYLITLRDEVTN